MGLGLNVMGMAAGYQGYKDELKDQEDRARRAAADEQAALDRAYLAEERSRQRYDWSEIDRMRGNRKNDAATYQRDNPFEGASPADGGSAAPAAAPAVAAPALATTAPAAAAPGTAPAAGQDGITDPASPGVTSYPVADPMAMAGISPLPLTAASGQAAPVDAGLAGAPLARRVGTAPPQLVPGQPVPIDAELAGAPSARAGRPLDQAAQPPLDSAQASAAAPAAPAAPVAPASQPAAAPVVPVAAGIPPPRQFGTILGMQTYILNEAAKRGDVPLEEYAKARTFLANLRAEGVTKALDLFDRGDYQGGVNAYNDNGVQNGAKLLGTPVQTMTKLPNGLEVPTRIVTLRTPNGDVVIDTARDRFSLLGIEKQVDLIDKAAKTKSEAEYHSGMVKVAEQQANTNEKYRQQMGNAADDANLVRALTGTGRGAANAGKADAKALKDALELNAHLYSYKPDPDKKEVEIPAAKSLYGNLMTRLGDPEKAYQIMAAFRTEALTEAVDPKTSAIDQNRFLAAYSAKVASADAALHRAAQAAAPTSGAGANQPGAKAGTKAATKPPAPDVPRVLPDASTVAQREAQMEHFNQTVGGGQDRARFEAAMAARRQDVATNFNRYLATIRPGMARADAQKVLAWLADQTEAGTLSNQQLKAARDARHAARL
jgi:hypothetical protein